jgi:hypothetical protein
MNEGGVECTAYVPRHLQRRPGCPPSPRRQPTRLCREELHSLCTLHSPPNCKQKIQDERRMCGLNCVPECVLIFKLGEHTSRYQLDSMILDCHSLNTEPRQSRQHERTVYHLDMRHASRCKRLKYTRRCIRENQKSVTSTGERPVPSWRELQRMHPAAPFQLLTRLSCAQINANAEHGPCHC